MKRSDTISLTHISRLILLGVIWGLSACQFPQRQHPEAPMVEQLVRTYFETWSKPDMEAYGQCFASEARIFFKTDTGALYQQGLNDFLHGQRMSHLNAKEKMVEVPDDIHIQMDDQGAQAFVTWTLSKGKEVSKGTDLFTYAKTKQGWKIVSLVFYESLTHPSAKN